MLALNCFLHDTQQPWLTLAWSSSWAMARQPY